MWLVLERALLLVGLSCVGYYGLATADAAYTERAARAAIEKRLAVPIPDTGNAAIGSSLIGLLEIPRLGVSTVVVEGDGGDALDGTAGHLPDTPRPWEKGNSAIAAHRDRQFRALRNIRIGDELRVETPHGEIVYRVEDTHVVLPTDLSVLEAKSDHMLTLITCYPFYYVGSAPKRFIVHATRVSPQPDSQPEPDRRALQPSKTRAADRTRDAAARDSKSSVTLRRPPKATKSTQGGNPPPSTGTRAAAPRSRAW
jgi:sortase A